MLVYQWVATILPISNYPTGLLRVENGDVGWCWDVEPSPKAHARLYINGNKYHLLGDQHPFRPFFFDVYHRKLQGLEPSPENEFIFQDREKHLDRYNIIYIYAYISLKNGDFTWLSRNHQKKDSTTAKKCGKPPKTEIQSPNRVKWLVGQLLCTLRSCLEDL